MIHIIDDYYALNNNYGYTAVRMLKKTGKKGEKLYTTLGYCGTLKEVLTLVLKDKAHDRMVERDMELSEALAYIREQTDRITKALEGIEV